MNTPQIIFTIAVCAALLFLSVVMIIEKYKIKKTLKDFTASRKEPVYFFIAGKINIGNQHEFNVTLKCNTIEQCKKEIIEITDKQIMSIPFEIFKAYKIIEE